MKKIDKVDQEKEKIEELRESLNSFLDMMLNTLENYREDIASLTKTSKRK
jgi:predicted  nucleic acid-binding Zn-ribbon protein